MSSNKLQHFFLVAYSNDETYSLTKAWLITAPSTCMGNGLPNCGTSTFSTIINSNTVVYVTCGCDCLKPTYTVIDHKNNGHVMLVLKSLRCYIAVIERFVIFQHE